MSDAPPTSADAPQEAASRGRNALTLVVAGLLLLVLLLRMVVFTVEESQVAVVLTFGKPSAERSEAGPGLKWPWPIQKVERFDARLRLLKAPLEQMSTRDGRSVLVGSFLLWRVDSARRFLEKVGDVASGERLLERLLRNHQAAAVSGIDFGQLVSADPGQLRYEEVEERMLAGVRAEARELGVEVGLVGIRRLGLPRAATEAVFDRMRKGRHALATDILEAGRREADKIKADAEARRADLLADAEFKARETLAQAETEARPHFARMAEDPKLAVFLKELEALGGILDAKTTLVFDTRQPPFDLLDRSGVLGEVAPVDSR